MTEFDWHPVVDAVAEAICNTHRGDSEAWAITFDKDAEHWRRTAEAAIIALKLTPQDVRLPYDEATMIIDGEPAYRYYRRLVSPLVEQ